MAPFIDACSIITAQLTTQGRQLHGYSLIEGNDLTFSLSGWNVGRGGYDPLNPVTTVAVDPALTALVDPLLGLSATRTIDLIEPAVADNVIVSVCRLSTTDISAQYGLGELGLYVTILTTNLDVGVPAEAPFATVGNTILYAVAHFPLMSFTPQHTLIWRVAVAM